ncbi:DUF4157 domain-containing protein [Paenarthrobacter sp. S56]|uniref:eCIS core domain-containing protein n=1 Tax=Paenarthrobacter sp. S56 TaxID=3138179 RepID=UPI00321B52A8
MTPGQRLRQIANAVNFSTPLGLLVAAASRSRLSKGPRGLLIAAGYRWKIPHARAFTLGNVILFRAAHGVAASDDRLMGHEERHSTQYAWCMGLPFLLFYGVAAAWSMLRTGNPGLANFFERQAGLEAGGYVDHEGQNKGIEAA